jgi:hypothetical protein
MAVLPAPMTALYRRVGFRELIRPHEVDAGQELVRGVHAVEVLARNSKELRQPGAGAHEYRGKTHAIEEVVEGDGLADDDVALDLDAETLEGGDLPVEDRVGQPELRNAITQHPARGVQPLEDSHRVADPRQLAGTDQTGRARADHCNPLGAPRWLAVLGNGLRALPISDESFQVAYGH